MILVLLVVCGNTANLVLARASSRRHEIGLRLAIGAGRWRIVSLLLSESLVLAAIGTVLGIGLAVWATEAMRNVPMPTLVPIRFITEIDFASCSSPPRSASRPPSSSASRRRCNSRDWIRSRRSKPAACRSDRAAG